MTRTEVTHQGVALTVDRWPAGTMSRGRYSTVTWRGSRDHAVSVHHDGRVFWRGGLEPTPGVLAMCAALDYASTVLAPEMSS